MEEFDELERDEIKEYITHMNSVANNIYELLNNLLDWSRIQTDKMYFNPSLFDIEEVITKVSRLFKDIAKSKRIKIDIKCDDRCYVFADENSISTVIRNLTSNAIKFSNDDSTVKIKAENEDKFVRVTVADNGIGMLPEDIAKLFRIDINYSTLGTRQEKGTGLGLILAKEMIEKNGGKIFVESALGKGSKFSFILPRSMK
jgi:signal transduction histidine kinase